VKIGSIAIMFFCMSAIANASSIQCGPLTLSGLSDQAMGRVDGQSVACFSTGGKAAPNQIMICGGGNSSVVLPDGSCTKSYAISIFSVGDKISVDIEMEQSHCHGPPTYASIFKGDCNLPK
jgi:hypothetical protein